MYNLAGYGKMILDRGRMDAYIRALRESVKPGSVVVDLGCGPGLFALMAAEHHLRKTRGQLPLEIQSSDPANISDWFSNKVNFSVKLPNYQESSGQEKLYTLEEIGRAHV